MKTKKEILPKLTTVHPGPGLNANSSQKVLSHRLLLLYCCDSLLDRGAILKNGSCNTKLHLFCCHLDWLMQSTKI